MKFVLAALIGSVSAVALECAPSCDCDPCYEEPACGCASGYAGAYGAGGAYAIGSQNAQLSGQERSGSYAKLTSESAGSNTNIGAQNIVIPDKHTVTDQAKVSESATRGSHQEQNCEVAKRTFDINGSICVSEKYNDSSKGQHSACKDGEGASQTRTRTQVQNNACAKADIPCTCAAGSSCGRPADSCCYWTAWLSHLTAPNIYKLKLFMVDKSNFSFF